MKTTEIYKLWRASCQNADLSVMKDCFSTVTKKYSNSKRYYHNLHHVGKLIEEIQKSTLTDKNKNILVNVALFHDVIYKVGRKDNEEKSAEFASLWLGKLNFESDDIRLICDTIKATSTHESSDFISQLFNDMDLSILGETESNYLQYIAQIRKEHTNIPGFMYKIGRKRFLKEMLSKKSIFSTLLYQNTYEAIARKNMTNELKAI